jgi:hypothetical protein
MEETRNRYRIMTGKCPGKQSLELLRNRYDNNIQIGFRDKLLELEVDGTY